MMKILVLISSVMLATAIAVAASDDAGFVWFAPDDFEWAPLEPGLEVAVLEGDPAGEGFYVLRVRFAPGAFSRPHYHPNARYVTVLEGTWWSGTGTVWDKEDSIPLGPGSYMKHPAGAPHYDGAKDAEVIVQISGMAPAPIIYVNESGELID